MLRNDDHAPGLKRWRLSPASTAWRLFFTCWVVYGLHFATDVVREHYPAVALGDDFTFGSFDAERQVMNCLREELSRVLPELEESWSAA